MYRCFGGGAWGRISLLLGRFSMLSMVSLRVWLILGACCGGLGVVGFAGGVGGARVAMQLSMRWLWRSSGRLEVARSIMAGLTGGWGRLGTRPMWIGLGVWFSLGQMRDSPWCCAPSAGIKLLTLTYLYNCLCIGSFTHSYVHGNKQGTKFRASQFAALARQRLSSKVLVIAFRYLK